VPEIECGFQDGQEVKGSDLLISFGPTLFADVGFDATWSSTGTIAPRPGIVKVRALVDTGADECCIDDALAVNLGLPCIDQRPCAGAGGEHELNMYLAQVCVPDLGFTMHGAFAGVHLTAGGQVHQVLIGRTFLRFFRMIYEGKTGSVRISQ
jgi:hypothetical protein